MRSALVLAGLLALTATACDSAGDIQPLGGVLVVSLAPASPGTLLLQSELDLPCAPAIATERTSRPERLTVTVLGTEPVDDACVGLLGPATATLPLGFSGPGPFAVEILYGGFSDEYAYSVGSGGARLDSVRTTVTRLGPR